MQKYILNFEKYALSVLRLGMGAIVLWFSIEQFRNTGFWAAYVPDFAVNLSGLSAITLVYINASFELIFTIMLLIGWKVRLSALLLSLHLIEIAFSMGYGENAVRDIGLAIALFVVFMNGSDILSIENKINLNMEPQNKSKKTGLIFGSLIVVLVAVVAVFAGKDDDDVVVQQQPTTLEDANIAANYKDGVYTSTGSYMSPGGPDEIDVTVTLANNVVTEIVSVAKPGDDVSKKYMKLFTDNYKTLVIGKNISEVKLDKVSGSSLTSIGFNNAISKIRSQAKI